MALLLPLSLAVRVLVQRDFVPKHIFEVHVVLLLGKH